MPDRSEHSASFLQRPGKPADEHPGLGTLRLAVTRSSRPAPKKTVLRRTSIGKAALKKREPFIAEVVASPEADFETAVAALVTKLAAHKDHSVQGVLVLPRDTREWRFSKAIAAAAREGVFARVSPLLDMQAGAQRILNELHKDSLRAVKDINAYSASVHGNAV